MVEAGTRQQKPQGRGPSHPQVTAVPLRGSISALPRPFRYPRSLPSSSPVWAILESRRGRVPDGGLKVP